MSFCFHSLLLNFCKFSPPSAHFSAYSSYSFSSFFFALLFYALLFSFTLIYIFVSFLLLFPLISQPILHILSHPFSLLFYSMSFCFHSLLFMFFFQFWLLPNLCLSFPTSFFFSLSLAIVCLFLSLSLFPFLSFILLPQSFDIISRYLASDFTLFTFFFLSDFLLSHSFLFISQSSSLSSRCSAHCSTFLILSHSPFVVPSVCYPHFLFPHSSHSFRILLLTICQHLYRDLKSCVASVGPPP